MSIAANQPEPGAEWLTIEETAKRWRVSYDTVRRNVVSGTIPAMPIGTQYRISREVVERMEGKAKQWNASEGLKTLRKSIARAVTSRDHYADC